MSSRLVTPASSGAAAAAAAATAQAVRVGAYVSGEADLDVRPAPTERDDDE